jgi:hypothetical protein
VSLLGRTASWNQLQVGIVPFRVEVLPLSVSGRTASWNQLPVGRIRLRVEGATCDSVV